MREMLPGRIPVSLPGLGHEVAHINTRGLTGNQRFLDAGMQKYPDRPREQRARTNHQQVRRSHGLEHSRMGRHRRGEEEPHNRRLRLTLDDLPFPNDAPSVRQLSPNLGITIRDRQHPLPESCCLAHLLHCTMQAPMALRQNCQQQIAYAHATQLSFGKAMAQHIPPHGFRIEERAQALACIPDLWSVQETTELAAMSTIVGHTDDGSHLASIHA